MLRPCLRCLSRPSIRSWSLGVSKFGAAPGRPVGCGVRGKRQAARLRRHRFMSAARRDAEAYCQGAGSVVRAAIVAAAVHG